MRIPFGPRIPNEKETARLIQLGFNLDNMALSGRYYFITTPESPRIRCERHTPDFDKIRYDIYYNDIQVISIHQKTAIYDSFVYFNFFDSAITDALAQNAVMTEAEMEAKLIKPVLSEYQTKLNHHLSQLVEIIFEGGASRGYGREIPVHLSHLKTLRTENTAEHDALIASNDRFGKLLDMFPNWTDERGVQANYTRHNPDPLIVLSAAFEDGAPNCKTM